MEDNFVFKSTDITYGYAIYGSTKEELAKMKHDLLKVRHLQKQYDFYIHETPSGSYVVFKMPYTGTFRLYFENKYEISLCFLLILESEFSCADLVDIEKLVKVPNIPTTTEVLTTTHKITTMNEPKETTKVQLDRHPPETTSTTTTTTTTVVETEPTTTMVPTTEEIIRTTTEKIIPTTTETIIQTTEEIVEPTTEEIVETTTEEVTDEPTSKLYTTPVIKKTTPAPKYTPPPPPPTTTTTPPRKLKQSCRLIKSPFRGEIKNKTIASCIFNCQEDRA